MIVHPGVHEIHGLAHDPVHPGVHGIFIFGKALCCNGLRVLRKK